MSDNFMKIVPRDPLWLPPADKRKAVVDLLNQLRPTADEVEVVESDLPTFIDATGHFLEVCCPYCAKALDFPWWHAMMDRWWGLDRRVLAIETPCCHRATTLNDLDYGCEQGFACFAVELRNPDGDLEPPEVAQIEAVLGGPIRVIWSHI